MQKILRIYLEYTESPSDLLDELACKILPQVYEFVEHICCIRSEAVPCYYVYTLGIWQFFYFSPVPVIELPRKLRSSDLDVMLHKVMLMLTLLEVLMRPLVLLFRGFLGHFRYCNTLKLELAFSPTRGIMRRNVSCLLKDYIL